MSSGGPLIWMSITVAAAGGASSTNLSFGSTTRVHTSRNTFPAPRFFNTTCTGADGAGKRSDSENVRLALCASAVVSHSP